MAGRTAMSSGKIFQLTGGALCLDFVNTLGDRPWRREEQLSSYADLLAWGRQAGLVEESEAGPLGPLAAGRPARARAGLARALALRESLYRIFSALAGGGEPAERDLRQLNAALVEALGRRRVVAEADGYRWGWAGRTADPDRVLWPVALSAAELLTSPERPLVRECASELCSWLFVDRSRTRRRRWCDMKTCGNRNKARRYYQRKKAQAAAAATAGPGSAGPLRRAPSRAPREAGTRSGRRG